MSATMEQWRWLAGADTGASSMTIWQVMAGEEAPRLGGFASRPYDADDVGRCVRLLDLFPTWRDRMPEVASEHAEWAPLVAAWHDIERLYRAGEPHALTVFIDGLYRSRCCCGRYVLGSGPNGERHDRYACRTGTAAARPSAPSSRRKEQSR